MLNSTSNLPTSLNTGYLVAILGILGMAVGAGMYAAGWHHTIGEGGIGLGIVLLIAGVWLSRQKPTASATQAASQPSAT